MTNALDQRTERPADGCAPDRHRPIRASDLGFTPIEMLLVVVVLGAVAMAGTLAVNGMRIEAANTGCQIGPQHLEIAATRYLNEFDALAIPATGEDDDRYERTLVDAGLLRDLDMSHDLDAAGVITTRENTTC